MAAFTDIVVNSNLCAEMSRGNGSLNDIDICPRCTLTANTCAEISRGNVGSLTDIKAGQQASVELGNDVAIFPSVDSVKIGTTFGWNNALTGTLIVGGMASGFLALTKATGSDARGGSGTCAKLTPTSTINFGYWHFYIPVAGSSPFAFSFWHKISSGWNGLLKVTVFDTDQVTKLLSSVLVSLIDDRTYHQHLCNPCAPTNTGMCLVRIEIEDGSTTGYVFIDDVGAA